MTQAQYTPGRILIILLGAGFLLVAIFSVIARNYSESGHVTMPQYDSAIYMQYARAIAEGHPYRFNESDPPSTGSTSHLYPLVLAVPYILGAKGDALVTAGFFLGALCYLGIIALVYLIARKLVPDLAVVAALIAGVLNGHALFACIGVTDVGLYAVVALSVISAALYRYWKLAALGLVIAVFTRPEGAVLSATFFATGLVAFLVKKDERKHALPLLIVGAVGILAVVAMLGLNYLLTGITTFHSVLSKSRGLYYPPSESLFISLNDGGKIIREFLFGLSGQGRQFYMLPVVGGLLGIIGLSVRQREDKTESLVEVAFLLACVGAVALVTQSGWQGFFWDRYFAWLLPLWLIYV
ncbi:MAG: hypothetical protein ACOC2L_03630, partial [Candidatus Sumerlaeota bacterium]